MTLPGAAIVGFIGLTVWIGVRTYSRIRGRAENYYVAGNAMPVAVVGVALSAQAFDANGSMGNAALVHAGGFWAGAVIPLGLAASLVLTGAFFARPLHRMRLLTLADFYGRRYDRTTETLAVLAMLASNVILVAGNLAGIGLLLQRVFGVGYGSMLVVIAICILTYAVTGGLYATITTSVLQVSTFIVALTLGFGWLLTTYGWSTLTASVPEDFMGLGGMVDPERGAVANWGSLVALALGDVVAIDFIQRVLAADSARTARRGCYIGAGIALSVGLMVSLIGLFAFAFDVTPGAFLLVDLALGDLPVMIGTLVLVGIVAASMSPAAGIVLDLANVISRNLIQARSRSPWSDARLLRVSRAIAFPTMIAAVVFAWLRPEPGVLLILAFDVVLAGCFVPLALGIYWRRANSSAAIASIVVGSGSRLLLHFVVPEELRGIDTVIAPLLSLLVFVTVALLTQRTDPPRHEALEQGRTEEGTHSPGPAAASGGSTPPGLGR